MKPAAQRCLALLCGLLAVATALSGWVAVDERLAWEVDVVREVQGWAFPGKRLSDVVRSATGTQVVLVSGAVAAVALWMLGLRRDAVALGALLILLPFVQAGLKDLVDRPRPSEDLVDIRGSITSESFPAGHVMSPTVLYGYLLYVAAMRARSWLAARWVVGVLCVVVLGLTGIVNVWLGVHWPTDVVGGYAWGAVLVLAGVATGTYFADRSR
jgi:undecaprenyl-diphosphatase